MQRSSLVVFVLSALVLAACGGETDGSSPAGSAGNSAAGSSNGGSDAGGSGGAGGNAQAGSGNDTAGFGGGNLAGTGGSGVAGQNSGGAGGAAGSGAAGQGGGEDLCKGICERDAQLSSELQCTDGSCSIKCPQIVAQLEQKGCIEIYKTLLDCAFQQPSSSFLCDAKGGGAELKNGFCEAEGDAVVKCLGF